MNEIFYTIFGRLIFKTIFIGKIDMFNEGEPSSVSFDHTKLLNKIKNNHNLIGFYHTHPNMDAFVSTTDYNTMSGWTISEGKPLFCLIEGNNGLKTYIFVEQPETVSFIEANMKIKQFGKFIFGWIKWTG